MYDAGEGGDSSLIPGSRGSPGGGNGKPLQYSCLENPMDRGGWPPTVHGAIRSQTWLKQLRMHKPFWYNSIQSVFNLPNWLWEKIYFLAFVLLTIFVQNFASNKEEMLIFLFFFLRKKFLQEVHTGRPVGPQQSKQEGKTLNLTLWVPPVTFLWQLTLNRMFLLNCLHSTLSCIISSCFCLSKFACL